MHLTTLSDYALRVLFYAAAAKDRLVTVEETARVYRISRSHLMKVVNILTRAGYLKGVRGRAGGFTLAKSPGEVNLGAVLRATEPDFGLVECFTAGNRCAITGCCKLPMVLNDALNAFVATFDRYTLADILLSERDFLAPPPKPGRVRGPLLPESRPAGR
ncbi:Rrf2 family transcriptional regulator [Shinella daejeonensis]|uniref:RrF2 family transcriptional regulator n=1 Tax=Shinella daejeonensis TaxID=659017 RepID=UPI0020C76FA6|nr:Rrf2 family transcriptional regulator [Shinella daejeonensis]MCP8894422.1 Rrf2 family transcriptional regulator [Shinella daejeonensis]